MNNNNRGNNRRRGRGNNRQQGGGGQPVNRIDSRARGNAPQLLEKYRKMALDAHLNGDRVQEEYYLQFADHYFRVLADQRTRQEEARQPRSDRWQEGGENDREDSDSAGEYSADRDYPPSQYNYGERRDETPRYEERPEAPAAAPAAAPEPRSEPVAKEAESATPQVAFEPAENPFVRDNNRGQRGLKPRRPRRESAKGGESESRPQRNDEDAAPAQLDLSVLPPSIATRDEDAAPAPAAEAKPGQRPGCRAIARGEPAREQPGAEQAQQRVDGEIERQQENRDPAKPVRHVRLIGESRRDPVVAEGEMADAEQPADHRDVLGLLRPRGDLDQQGQRQQSQWPEA